LVSSRMSSFPASPPPSALCLPLPPRPTLFPYTTLFRSGLLDRDRDLQDRLKRAADIKVLSLAADKHRYRLERARKLARGLHCRRSEEHTSELQPPDHLECSLLLVKNKSGGGQSRLQFFD